MRIIILFLYLAVGVTTAFAYLTLSDWRYWSILISAAGIGILSYRQGVEDAKEKNERQTSRRH